MGRLTSTGGRLATSSRAKIDEFIGREPGISVRASSSAIAAMSVYGGAAVASGSSLLWLLAVSLVLFFGWQVDTTMIHKVEGVDLRIAEASRSLAKEELRARIKDLAQREFKDAHPDWRRQTSGHGDEGLMFYWGWALYVETSPTDIETVIEDRSSGSVPWFSQLCKTEVPSAPVAHFGEQVATGCLATKSLTIQQGLHFAFTCYVPGVDLHFGKVDATATTLSDGIESDPRIAVLMQRVL